jgi:hypothetical protein
LVAEELFIAIFDEGDLHARVNMGNFDIFGMEEQIRCEGPVGGREVRPKSLKSMRVDIDSKLGGVLSDTKRRQVASLPTSMTSGVVGLSKEITSTAEVGAIRVGNKAVHFGVEAD